jgi:hypothetical protein
MFLPSRLALEVLMAERTEVRGELVRLDYSVLRDTNFVECKLIYGGGRPPILQNCDFIDSEFILEGHAQATAHFLAILGRSGAGHLVIHQMLGLTNWVEKTDG